MNKKEAWRLAAWFALLAVSFLFDNVIAGWAENLQSELRVLIATGFDRAFVVFYTVLFILTFASPFPVSRAQRAKSGPRTAIAAVSAILVLLALTYLLKFLVHRTRPFGQELVVPFFDVPDYSFPSAHVAAAAVMAFTAPRALRPLWAGFTALTVFSRLALNAHFLSDTIAAVALAAFVSSFVHKQTKPVVTGNDQLELRRQFVHMLLGLLVAFFVWKNSDLWFVLLIVAAVGIVLSYTLRFVAAALAVLPEALIIKKIVQLAVSALSLVERKEELRKLPGKGAITLFLGSGITAALFRQEAAIAIIILAVGDSVSHVAGMLFGRTKYSWPFDKEKSVEGTIFGIIAASALVALFIPAFIAVVVTVAAMLIEALRIKFAGWKVDDNLTVPLAAALCLWFIGNFVVT